MVFKNGSKSSLTCQNKNCVQFGMRQRQNRQQKSTIKCKTQSNEASIVYTKLKQLNIVGDNRRLVRRSACHQDRIGQLEVSTLPNRCNMRH